MALSQTDSSKVESKNEDIVLVEEKPIPISEESSKKKDDEAAQPNVVVTTSSCNESATHTGLAGVLGGIIGALAVIVIILIILSNESWVL